MIDFFQVLKEHGNRVAFRYFDEDNLKEVTYLQYYNDICECLDLLSRKHCGAIQDCHIATILSNSYEYIVFIAAVILGGGVLVPLNTLEATANKKQMIDDADIDILVTEDMDETDYGVAETFHISELHEFESEKIFSHEFDAQDENKLSLIVYTSGTTGRAKGVMLPLKSLFQFRKEILPQEYRDGNAVEDILNAYLVFPMYHVAGLCSWISWCLKGAIIYLNQNIGSTLLELEKIRIDYAFVPPAVMKLWYKALKRGGIEKLGGIKAISTTGAPADKSIIEYFVSNGISFSQFYGMTESFGEITCNFDTDSHIDSVGQKAHDTDVKIIDGEICISSWANMLGYYKDDFATKECLVDEWIHTGDLGYLDDDGYLYITGRKKNLIILSGGENINPEEIENILNNNPFIRECVIFERNDRIIAGIYADEKDALEIKEFVKSVNNDLPIFKRIHKIEFSDKEFPKTASGKIRRV